MTDIYSDALDDNIELNDIGFLMALTGSADINKYAIQKFKNHFGENGAFRLVTEEEKNDPTNNPKEGLFSHTDDFALLTRTAQDYPTINEVLITDKTHYNRLIKQTIANKNTIPLFLKDKEGALTIISSFNKNTDDTAIGFTLVYLGKPINTQEKQDKE